MKYTIVRRCASLETVDVVHIEARDEWNACYGVLRGRDWCEIVAVFRGYHVNLLPDVVTSEENA